MPKYYNVGVKGDTSQYERSMMRASSVTESFGRTITRFLGPAVLASVGREAIKMGVDFSMSMTKIETLVGLSRKEVTGLRKDVLDMASVVGKSPQELAEGLYYITSSGIDASHAMEALKSAAQASALGMGETGQIADALTSIMNAYGHSAYSAERATNILLRTVKVGKIEADELAGSMGTVIPTAARMGVSFEQVGAALATMSLSGINASEATTALNSMLTSLLNPSEQAEKIITALYGSTMNLRNEIRERGLLDVLLELKEKLGDNITNTAQLFNEKRALKAMLSLTGAAASQYTLIMGEMESQIDDVGEAMKRLEEEPGQKWNQFLALSGKYLTQWGDDFAREVIENIQGFRREMDIIKNDPLIAAMMKGSVSTPTTQSPFQTDEFSAASLAGFKEYGSEQAKAFEESQKLGAAVVQNTNNFESQNSELDALIAQYEAMIEAMKSAKKESEFFMTAYEDALYKLKGPTEGPSMIGTDLEPMLTIDESNMAGLEKATHSWREYTEQIEVAAQTLNVFQSALSTLSDYQQAMNQNNMLALTAQHEQELEVFKERNEGNADYYEKLDQLQRKQKAERNAELRAQAEQRKKMAMYMAALAIPQSFLQGLIAPGGGAILGGAYAAIAAAQLAVIKATDVPSFNIGTTSFGGVAKLHPGETLTNLPAGTKVESKGMTNVKNQREQQVELRLDGDQVVMILDRLIEQHNVKIV